MEASSYILSRLKESFSNKKSNALLSILLEDMPEIKAFSKLEMDAIAHRIIKGEPIQYVTGVAPFYGYFFKVDTSVLIPRPETEELVYCVEKFIKKQGLEQCRILDIGTGSGCIPITLSKLFPKAEIFGLDISESALALARSNNLKMGTNVNFLSLNILNESEWEELLDFDVIISNPPYIPIREKDLMKENVLDYEPHLALFVENEDEFIFYKKIHDLTVNKIKNAAVFLECNEFNAQQVASIFDKSHRTQVIKDLQQKDRIVVALGK